MAVNRDRALVKDIIDHASEAVAISGGRRRGDLDTDLQFRYAGERLIEIVGEAAGKLSPEFRGQQPEIPWNLIIGMRNRLIHGYGEVNLDRLWATLADDLPKLVANLKDTLQDMTGSK
jgi:uncharacterized protein with HEPN domain